MTKLKSRDDGGSNRMNCKHSIVIQWTDNNAVENNIDWFKNIIEESLAKDAKKTNVFAGIEEARKLNLKIGLLAEMELR